MSKIIFVLLFLLPLYTSGQQEGQLLIDSLTKRLSQAKEDTNKIKILDDLSFLYHSVDPDKGLEYGQRAKELSERLNWKKGMARAYADLGINYEAQSNHPIALNYNIKALTLCQELGDKDGIFGNLSNISIIYLAQCNYAKALEYAFKALGMSEDAVNKKGKADKAGNLGNIGNIYIVQKKYRQAYDYYNKALSICEEIGDSAGITRNLGNMGIIEDAQGNYSAALALHQKALKSNEEWGNKYSVQINLANIGLVYDHMGDHNKSLTYHLKALKVSQELKDQSNIAVNLGNIGEAYLAIAKDTLIRDKGNRQRIAGKQASINMAIKYMEQAVVICREINFFDPQIEFDHYLAEAYSLSGRYDKAFERLTQYNSLKDSIYSMQNGAQISALETKRELEIRNKNLLLKEKQIQIDNLEERNERDERVIFISGISLLLLLLVILSREFIRQMRNNKALLKQQEIHLETIQNKKDALFAIAQIQSHDVRGPVASILGLSMLYNYEDALDPINAELMQNINTAAHELDEVIKKVVITTAE